jgi:hypothetical protein
MKRNILVRWVPCKVLIIVNVNVNCQQFKHSLFARFLFVYLEYDYIINKI